MKKILAGLMAAVTVASAAMAADGTATATSANAVGFIQVSFAKAGDLKPVVMPFDLLNSSDTTGIEFIKTQLAEDLEPESYVYFWDAAAQSWESAKKEDDPDDGPTWAPKAQKKVLAYGEMFFVQPATAGNYTLAGEVPDAPTTQIAMRGAKTLNAVGFSYPAPVKFIDTDLAKNAPIGTKVYFWDEDVGTWASNLLEDDPDDGPTWAQKAQKKTLEPGEGFFVEFPGDAGLTAWEQSKPYTWP